jgi:hypothetical protein
MRMWQAAGRGSAYVGFPGRPPGAGGGWPGRCAGCEGPRNRGAATSADGGTPAGRPTALSTRRPDGAGRPGEAAAPRAMDDLPGHPGHAASLAPRAGGSPLDVSAARPGSAGSAPELVDLVVQMARDNPRWRYLRIVGECRKLGVAVSATSVRRSPPRLDGVPARSRQRHAGLRLLHHRNDRPDQTVRNALKRCGAD